MSFTGNCRDIHSQLFVTNQPQANLNLGSLDFKQSIPIHEKSLDALLEDSYHHHCEHGQISSFSEHHNCHNILLRRVLLPAIFAFVVLGGMLAWSFVNWHGFPAWEVDLMGRTLGKRSASTWFDSNLHLFLVIGFGGAALIIILCVVFSAYMCIDVFQKPSCILCYICGRCYGEHCIIEFCNCVSCGGCKPRPRENWGFEMAGGAPGRSR